jgi:hypothetical protein
VILLCDEVKQPVAVRYAWASNPECNLTDSDGLPASPFRTDNWKLLTQPKKSRYNKIISIFIMDILLLNSCARQGSKNVPKNDFITVKEGQFIRNGKPYYYIGTTTGTELCWCLKERRQPRTITERA